VRRRCIDDGHGWDAKKITGNHMLKKLFAPGNDSLNASFGLLLLRVWVGLTMLLAHGIDKLTHFKDMTSAVVDPFGIGKPASMALLVFAEVFASAMLVAGLMTRFAAFVLAIAMSVAFWVAHKGALKGEHGGELAFLYLATYVTLLITGPGRCSVDRYIFASNPKPA
jgi:putative oxidoreductase